MSKQGVYDFYLGRIRSCSLYGFRAGEELLNVVICCARADSMLTDDEYNSIIKRAHECHNKMMEDNYNAGWQDQ